ncbi:MAG: ferrous iron transport protein A [Hymenobacter sp.]|nr:MAG: ferrous iron transport protein A [Hymenobacter sp.]
MRRPTQRLLAELEVGERGTLAAVKDTSAPFLQYLDKVGLPLGATLNVLGRIEFDNSLEVCIDDERTVLLSAEVGRNLFTTEV